MRRACLWLSIFSLVYHPVGWAGAPIGVKLDEAVLALEKHVGQSKFRRAIWGIKIVSLTSGCVLFEHNANKLLKPASNAKLFSGALALDRLGPAYRIQTSVYAVAPPKNGILDGDLVVLGRGDPSMAERFHEGMYDDWLRPLAQAIAQTGAKIITGDLVGDETYFSGPSFGSSWTWEDLQYYFGAGPSALTVQDNVIDVVVRAGHVLQEPCQLTLKPESSFVEFVNRTTTCAADGKREITLYRPVGSNKVFVAGQLPLNSEPWNDAVAVHNPALWFVALLQEQLKREGVEIKGTVRTRSWPEEKQLVQTGLIEIAHVHSMPLTEILSKMIKPSQNLYAQLLLLQVGANSTYALNELTENAGVRELQDFVLRAGIEKEEVRLDEGSGLSRTALVTPNAIVKLLSFMSQHIYAETFRNSLPIAGVDGTLRNRLQADGVRGNVRAKTGTIRYVNTLSGYMQTVAGEDLAFSIMLNAYSPDPGGTARDEIDFIPLLLSQINERTRP